MKKTWKHLIAIICALSMIACLLPVTILAEEGVATPTDLAPIMEPVQETEPAEVSVEEPAEKPAEEEKVTYTARIAVVKRDGKILLTAVVEPEYTGAVIWEMKTLEADKVKWTVVESSSSALMILPGSNLIGKEIRFRLEDGTTSVLSYVVPEPEPVEAPVEVSEEGTDEPAVEINQEEPVEENEKEPAAEETVEEPVVEESAEEHVEEPAEESAEEEQVIADYETPLGLGDEETAEPEAQEEPAGEQPEEVNVEPAAEEPVVEESEELEIEIIEEEPVVEDTEIVEIVEETEEIEDYLTALGLDDTIDEEEELPETVPAEQGNAAEEENAIVEDNDSEVIVEIIEEEPVVIYVYERDENGELVLDENGNPIVTVVGDGEIPVTYQRDENGVLVLDENGDPIPTQMIPADAVIVRTLEDALNPDRTIDIYYSWNNQTPALGGDVTFIAVLNGYDNLEYAIQWQQSKDTVNWNDVAGATGARYTEIITRDNYRDYWRVQVTITGVLGE